MIGWVAFFSLYTAYTCLFGVKAICFEMRFIRHNLTGGIYILGVQQKASRTTSHYWKVVNLKKIILTVAKLVLEDIFFFLGSIAFLIRFLRSKTFVFTIAKMGHNFFWRSFLIIKLDLFFLGFI